MSQPNRNDRSEAVLRGTASRLNAPAHSHGGLSHAALVAAVCTATLAGAAAHGADVPIDLGSQYRANAASKMIVLAVQQAISSLPPSSGQSFAYTYDPKTLTFVADAQLGPTAFLSTYTVGKGKIALRTALSYFEMSDSFGPINYFVESDFNTGYGKLGLDTSATVGLLNLSASYGVTPRIELTMNLPVSVVDAQASQTFTTLEQNADVPADEASWEIGDSLDHLDRLLQAGFVVIRDDPFEALGFQFNSGTSVGVGRISLGGKGVIWAGQRLRVALAPQLYFPSPSEAEFAGPNSAAILPRVVAQVKAADFLQLLADVGYEYDFESSELSRFAWNLGATVPGSWYSVDAGFGGSQYNTGIRWTPTVASGTTSTIGEFTLSALQDNQLGTTFVDFLAGVKVKLLDQLVFSGAVAVPVTDDGFRPDALGTIAVELYF